MASSVAGSGPCQMARTTSRKCPESVDSCRHWRAARVRADVPMRTANTGISGSVTAMTTAEIQSAAATRASTATGTATGEGGTATGEGGTTSAP